MRLPIELEKEVKEGTIEVFPVKHLPIVKEFAERIGLVEVVNQLVPSMMYEEPGLIVLGMVLDTLSGRTPLYRLHEFFEEQDTQLLLGKKVDASSFEDHNVGRVLDKLYETGSMQIFSEVCRRAVIVFSVNTRHVSFDTTSKSVFGEYDLYGKEAENAPFTITYGHSKDHRPDLKQFLISMLCADRNIPIFGKIEDGNGSDKRINNEVLSSVSKHMALHGLKEEAFIYIADSALVTQANLEKMGDDILFITRLPAVYGECDRLIKKAIEKDEWEQAGVLAATKPTVKRPAAFYKTYETETVLYGRTYRAIVVHSSSHDKRRQKKIDRELKREYNDLKSSSKKLSKKEFFCEADALQAVEELKKENRKYHRLQAEVIQIPKYKRGRPKNGVRLIREMRYGLDFEIEQDKASVEKLRKMSGCFVLLCNVSEEFGDGYDSKAILKTYKDQYGIEQNFGFLKDPVIVNSIFLDKAERIEALGLILLLSLLIWRLIEYSMRKHLEQTGKDLPGWEKRRTQRPTSFMLTTKFSAIMVVKVGTIRMLNKPFNSQQLEYLNAMGIDPQIFIKPGIG